MSVILIPALQDNYQHLIICEETRQAAIVDPAEAESVFPVLKKYNVKLSLILNTHHHWDHVGGNQELAEHFGIPILCSQYDVLRITGASKSLVEGDEVAIGNLRLKVLDVPGHTLGHIAYYGHSRLFCGDTLFGAGCGRLFEGTPAMMVAALNKLSALSPETLVHCGHEYTLNNLLFAKTLEPGNAALLKKLDEVRALRREQQPTVPSTLREEFSYNPFLRTHLSVICDALTKIGYENLHDELAIFTALREYKNGF